MGTVPQGHRQEGARGAEYSRPLPHYAGFWRSNRPDPARRGQAIQGQRPGECSRTRALAAAEATGEPLGEADSAAGRTAQTQPGVDQRLPVARGFPAVLGLSTPRLRGKVSRQLGDPGTSNRLGTDEESGPDAAQPQAADPQLVQGQRAAFQRGRGGYESQGETHHEKSLRFQNPEMPANRLIS